MTGPRTKRHALGPPPSTRKAVGCANSIPLQMTTFRSSADLARVRARWRGEVVSSGARPWVHRGDEPHRISACVLPLVSTLRAVAPPKTTHADGTQVPGSVRVAVEPQLLASSTLLRRVRNSVVSDHRRPRTQRGRLHDSSAPSRLGACIRRRALLLSPSLTRSTIWPTRIKRELRGRRPATHHPVGRSAAGAGKASLAARRFFRRSS